MMIKLSDCLLGFKWVEIYSVVYELNTKDIKVVNLEDFKILYFFLKFNSLVKNIVEFVSLDLMFWA